MSERDREPRGWVVRLGVYARIFGRQAVATGTHPLRANGGGMVETAQKREGEFGRG